MEAILWLALREAFSLDLEELCLLSGYYLVVVGSKGGREYWWRGEGQNLREGGRLREQEGYLNEGEGVVPY